MLRLVAVAVALDIAVLTAPAAQTSAQPAPHVSGGAQTSPGRLGDSPISDACAGQLGNNWGVIGPWNNSDGSFSILVCTGTFSVPWERYAGAKISCSGAEPYITLTYDSITGTYQTEMNQDGNGFWADSSHVTWDGPGNDTASDGYKSNGTVTPGWQASVFHNWTFYNHTARWWLQCNSVDRTPPNAGMVPARLGTHAMPALAVLPTGAMYADFFVTFQSAHPGQGYVLFGPSCSGLVFLASEDGTNDTTHGVLVGSDSMNPGSTAVLPGATYYYMTETVTKSGVETDDNAGNCYSVTIPTTSTAPAFFAQSRGS